MRYRGFVKPELNDPEGFERFRSIKKARRNDPPGLRARVCGNYISVVRTFFRWAKRGRAFSLGALISPWMRGST